MRATIREVAKPDDTPRAGERCAPHGLGAPLQRLLLGIRIKIAIIEKIKSAGVPSALSHKTKRPLRRRKSILSFSGNADLLGAYKTLMVSSYFHTPFFFVFKL